MLDREIERLVELGITIKTNVEVGKDVTWDDLKKNYDACVLAVGLIDPNSVRAEGEDKDGVHLRTSLPSRHRHGHIQGQAGRVASPSSAAETPPSTAPAKRCGKARSK